jgi:capsular exopolysaccharide synthesis family protein
MKHDNFKKRQEMGEIQLVKNFPETSLRDFYYVIFRQKRKVILFFCAVMLTTALGTFLSAKTYQSDAKLMVRLGRESVSLDPTAATGQMINLSQSRENEIRSEMEILNSRALVEQVVDAIGYQAFLTRDPDELIERGLPESTNRTGRGGSAFSAEKTLSPDQLWDRDQAIRRLTKNLQIDFLKNSNIITISCTAPSQKLSQLVAAKLIDFYLDKHISVHRTPGSDEFFSRQAEELRHKLAKTEEALRDLKNQTGVASVPEHRTILMNRIGNLQRSLGETEAAAAATRSKVQAMQSTMAGLPKTLLRTKLTGYSGNPIDYLEQRLHDLQLKEQDLLSKYTEKTQLVQEVRRQIDEIEALLKKEDATHGQVTQLALLVEKATLSELQAKDGALKGELTEAQGDLRNLNDNEIKLVQLQREAEIQTANYRNYADKLEQARIDRALEMGRISNISIVQPATFPVKPIRPRKALNLALGLFLAVFGGLGIAFLAEYLDHSFRTPMDVERMLQLPVLTIPLLARDGLVAVVEEKNPAHVPKYKLMQGISVQTKECQAIINHLLLADADSQQTNPVLAVTSCHTGEGVSSVAASVAISLANRTEGRILLVDANLKQPSIHKIFGVNRLPGLIDILSNGRLNAFAIKPSSIKNLDLLTSGNGELNLGLPFDAQPFADLLSLWRREYSFVIFDTPPLEEVTAGMRLTQLADGVILVVEADRTRWEVAQQAKEMLTKSQVNILGVVLNKRQFPIPKWLYRTL